MAGSYGYQGQLGIDTNNPVTQRFDFDSESVMQRAEFRDTNGLRGTRSRAIERNLASIIRVGGGISFQPTSNELALLLPWIMCGTTSGSPTVTYNLGELATTRFITVDRKAKVYTYAGCAVDRARFHASQAEPLAVDIDVIGQTET